MWNPFKERIEKIFKSLHAFLDAHWKEKTLKKEDICEGESLQMYQHILKINIYSDNKCTAWVYYCQALKYWESKQYRDSVSDLVNAV